MIKNINIFKNVYEFFKIIILAVIFALLITRIMVITTIIGKSMEPTFYNKERYVVNKLAYINNFPQKNDIVVFKPDKNYDKYLIKRVIAVENDDIEIKNNSLYINDELIKEEYIKEPMFMGDIKKIRLSEGEIFVMGDNRNNSLDSRMFGPVNVDNVLGKLIIFKKQLF